MIEIERRARCGVEGYYAATRLWPSSVDMGRLICPYPPGRGGPWPPHWPARVAARNEICHVTTRAGVHTGKLAPVTPTETNVAGVYPPDEVHLTKTRGGDPDLKKITVSRSFLTLQYFVAWDSLALLASVGSSRLWHYCVRFRPTVVPLCLQPSGWQ